MAKVCSHLSNTINFIVIETAVNQLSAHMCQSILFLGETIITI